MAGDLSQVSKSEFFSERRAGKIWESLFNQHIERHGLPESYISYIQKMRKAVSHYAKVSQGKKWEIVKARIYETEAQEMLSGKGERIETTCAQISKFMGFPVRANTCSVIDFYNYVDIMQRN